MRWLKRDTWMVGIPLAALLLLQILMVWVPMSANAYESTSGLAASGMVQAIPTVDVTATMTALQEEKLRQEIQQIKSQTQNQNNWLFSNSTAFIAAVATVLVALFGIFQWAITVRQAQDKDRNDRKEERQKEVRARYEELKAQAEERFQTAVAALGDEKEGTQVGGAILLRSFLNINDESIYGRYYIQIFDLAVAYLSTSSTSHPSEDPDGIPHPPEDPNTPLPLTPLRQALVVVFKESFPLARKKLNLEKLGFEVTALDASRIQLDGAFLSLTDLNYIWMREASLRKAILINADMHHATLVYTDLRGAYLSSADLKNANLVHANLSGTDLSYANLSGANLAGAILNKTNLQGARSLKGTNLQKVKGLTKEQLEVCKARGAIIDEDTTTDSPQSAVQTAQPSQGNDAHTQSATPTPTTDESSSTSSQPSGEP
jgi:Pentapeptide repeats (8 copies)